MLMLLLFFVQEELGGAASTYVFPQLGRLRYAQGSRGHSVSVLAIRGCGGYTGMEGQFTLLMLTMLYHVIPWNS